MIYRAYSAWRHDTGFGSHFRVHDFRRGPGGWNVVAGFFGPGFFGTRALRVPDGPGLRNGGGRPPASDAPGPGWIVRRVYG